MQIDKYPVKKDDAQLCKANMSNGCDIRCSWFPKLNIACSGFSRTVSDGFVNILCIFIQIKLKTGSLLRKFSYCKNFESML